MRRPMTFPNFATASTRFWDAYLETVWAAVQRGQIVTTTPDPVPSFPQSLLATTLPNHFVMELIGGRSRHRPLRLLKHSLADTDLYFGQFAHAPGTPAMIDFANSDHSGLATLALISPRTETELDRRFPAVSSIYASKLQWGGEPEVLPLRVGPEANFLSIDDCLLVNSLGPAVRIRNIRLASVIRRTTSESDYTAYLRETFAGSARSSGECEHRLS